MKALQNIKIICALKMKFFKYTFLLILYIILGFICLHANAQTFSRTWGSPEDLTGAVGSCATPGTEDLSWYKLTVAGVGVLNTTSNALTAITFTVDNSCTGTTANMKLVQLRIMAPDGTCAGVYYGDNASGLDATASLSGTQTMTLITAQNCTDYPNLARTGTGTNRGIFSAKYGTGAADTPTNLQTSFNGVNANGDWKFIFSEGTGSEPCLKFIGLTFGDVSVFNAVDETSNGETCATAINMCSRAACVSTNGRNNEANSPGADQVADVNTVNFNNGTCAWNNANNNDVWIKFQAASTSMNIDISSLDQSLQSVVVTHPTGDGSTCPTLGTEWNFVSCPRDAIYTSTSGANYNHNHSFSTTIGQYYYFVIDGTGGLESPFYVNIQDGTSCVPLPIVIGQIDAKNFCSENLITWTTLSERNNDYFIIEEKINDTDFTEIARIKGAGNSSSERSYEFVWNIKEFSKNYYYRITQVDYDGKRESFNLISVLNECNKEMIYFSQNLVNISGFNQIQKIEIFDMLGRKIIETTDTTVDINYLSSSFYNVMVTAENGNQMSNKIYKP
jgi:hypothetical protein